MISKESEELYILHWISNISVYIITTLAYKSWEQTSTISMLQTIYQRLLEKSLFSKSNINIMTANTYFTPQMFPTKYPASYTYVKKIARVATEWTKLLYWFAILSILGHNCRMGLQLDAFFLCAQKKPTLRLMHPNICWYMQSRQARFCL